MIHSYTTLLRIFIFIVLIFYPFIGKGEVNADTTNYYAEINTDTVSVVTWNDSIDMRDSIPCRMAVCDEETERVTSGVDVVDTLEVDSVKLGDYASLPTSLSAFRRERYSNAMCQLNDTLVVLKPRPIRAVVENLSINALVLSFDYFVQQRDYARISRHVLKHNFKTGMVWDQDSFSGNQFSHPFHGSMFFNAARENGLNFWQSIAFPVVGSLTWEFMCETNEPALNDLLSTGVGGVLLGEVCHRVSDLILDETVWGIDRVVREVFGNVVNPVRGVKRLCRGQWWHRGTSRGKEEPVVPVDIQLGVGNRYLSTKSGFTKGLNVPYVSFDMTYNDRFDDSGHDPFDWFRVKMLFNFSSKQSTVGDLDIRGRLANVLLHSKNEYWKFDLALYQLLKYVETYPVEQDILTGSSIAGADQTRREFNQNVSDYPIISEAVSVGGGAYSEYNYKKLQLNNDLIVAAVILGGQRSDYYPCRTYNFSQGFSVRNDFETVLFNRLTLGDDFYYARFFTFGKYDDKELRYRLDNGLRVSTQGDRGQSTIIVNRLYAITELFKGINLKVESVLHYRHSNYKYYPSVTGKHFELNMGLVCKL